MSDYTEGNILVAGEIRSAQVPLVADTYYQGMPLKYEVDGSVVAGSNTGTGTLTAVTAGPDVAPGAYVVTLTAALVAKIEDPNGAVLAAGLPLADGAAETFNINGLRFTITDGGTAFVAGDLFTVTIGTAGKYEYTTGTPNAIYNGADARVLSSAGVGSVIIAGEIYEGGVVDDSGTAITFTEASRAAYAAAGFFVKQI